jgi:hypothetical protein
MIATDEGSKTIRSLSQANAVLPSKPPVDKHPDTTESTSSLDISLTGPCGANLEVVDRHNYRPTQIMPFSLYAVQNGHATTFNTGT